MVLRGSGIEQFMWSVQSVVSGDGGGRTNVVCQCQNWMFVCFISRVFFYLFFHFCPSEFVEWQKNGDLHGDMQVIRSGEEEYTSLHTRQRTLMNDSSSLGLFGGTFHVLKQWLCLTGHHLISFLFSFFSPNFNDKIIPHTNNNNTNQLHWWPIH